MTRLTRKHISSIAEGLGCRLVTHQLLGNRKDYYYKYSLMRGSECLIDMVTLKDIQNRIAELIETDFIKNM